MKLNKYSIGTSYHGKSTNFFKAVLPYVNHLEVTPETIAHYNSFDHYIKTEILDDLLLLSKSENIVLRGEGLCLGSYDGYTNSYLKVLLEIFNSIPVKRHSELLAYTFVSNDFPGSMLTLPKTNEALQIICRRIDAIQKKIKIPFLIENVVSMFPVSECCFTNAAFLNKIIQLTGCGLVLDLFNLECDAGNFNFSIVDFLDELNVDSLKEIRMSGNLVEKKIQMDHDKLHGSSNSLHLVELLINRHPKNLAAVTYEFQGECLSAAATVDIINQLMLIDKLFNAPEKFFNENFSVIPQHTWKNNWS